MLHVSKIFVWLSNIGIIFSTFVYLAKPCLGGWATRIPDAPAGALSILKKVEVDT